MCETVKRRPASLVVARVIRPKFVREDRERGAETEILIAEPPELPIPRGLAGPGMLADSIVKRLQDHLPLHRLDGRLPIHNHTSELALRREAVGRRNGLFAGSDDGVGVNPFRRLTLLRT